VRAHHSSNSIPQHCIGTLHWRIAYSDWNKATYATYAQKYTNCVHSALDILHFADLDSTVQLDIQQPIRSTLVSTLSASSCVCRLRAPHKQLTPDFRFGRAKKAPCVPSATTHPSSRRSLTVIPLYSLTRCPPVVVP